MVKKVTIDVDDEETDAWQQFISGTKPTANFDPSQERDENGRWTDGGGGGGGGVSFSEKDPVFEFDNTLDIDAFLHGDQWSDLKTKMTDVEKEAVATYQSQESANINRSLYGDKEADAVTAMKTVAGLDKMYDRPEAHLREGIVAYRVSGEDFYESLEPGATIENKGYTSTTLSTDYVETFLGDNGYHGAVVFKIEAPAGVRAISLDAVNKSKGESEVLFDRGTSWVVKSSRELGSGRERYKEVTVRVVVQKRS